MNVGDGDAGGLGGIEPKIKWSSGVKSINGFDVEVSYTKKTKFEVLQQQQKKKKKKKNEKQCPHLYVIFFLSFFSLCFVSFFLI